MSSTPTAPEIADLVRRVIAEIAAGQQHGAPAAEAVRQPGVDASAAAGSSGAAGASRPAAAYGIHATVSDAVVAAESAFHQL